MDKRTLHEANMDRPTQRDTTFEDYLMTIGCNLTCWEMETLDLVCIYSTNDLQHLYWYSTATISMLDNVLIIYVMTDGNLYLERLFLLGWWSLWWMNRLWEDFWHNGYHGHTYPLSCGDIISDFESKSEMDISESEMDISVSTSSLLSKSEM